MTSTKSSKSSSRPPEKPNSKPKVLPAHRAVTPASFWKRLSGNEPAKPTAELPAGQHTNNNSAQEKPDMSTIRRRVWRPPKRASGPTQAESNQSPGPPIG